MFLKPDSQGLHLTVGLVRGELRERHFLVERAFDHVLRQYGFGRALGIGTDADGTATALIGGPRFAEDGARVLNTVCLVVVAAALVVWALGDSTAHDLPVKNAPLTSGEGMSSFCEVCGRAVSGCLDVAGRRTILKTPARGRMRVVSDRAAVDLERELAMLAFVRGRLWASEGDDVRSPTTAVDQVLDGLSSLARSPWVPS